MVLFTRSATRPQEASQTRQNVDICSTDMVLSLIYDTLLGSSCIFV